MTGSEQPAGWRRYIPISVWLLAYEKNHLAVDLVAALTVWALVVPEAMAYASLAGLPVVYGLYASFLPVIVASMWGASRFLHTGPVAMLSLMSAAAIEPLASRGTEEFIQLSMLLALLVGILRLALGLFRMGVLINLASHPVILGFTNAAALIIGLSLLNSFLGVPMPRSDSFLADLWQVVQQVPMVHIPTLLFGLGTLAALHLLRARFPKLPGVSGSRSSTSRPALVSVLGLATHFPPQASIMALRYGFWSKLTLTIYTLQFRPNCAHAKDRALPHWPAPVSVVIFSMPNSLL